MIEQAGSTGTRSPLVVRPHKVRQVVIPIAALLVVIFIVLAVTLNGASTGVHLGISDKISLALVGAILAGGVLLLARPKVRADAEGVEVRNLLFGRVVPWQEIKGVSFPDGAPWARLDLPRDEYVPVVAIQAIDGERAVHSIRELRAWYRDAAGREALSPRDSAKSRQDSAT